MCEQMVYNVFTLQIPAYGLAVLKEWRTTLEDNPGAFELLLRVSWLPQVRRAVTSEWDPHDCEALLAVIEAWQALLPEAMLQQDILDGVILPRLRVSLPLFS